MTRRARAVREYDIDIIVFSYCPVSNSLVAFGEITCAKIHLVQSICRGQQFRHSISKTKKLFEDTENGIKNHIFFVPLPLFAPSSGYQSRLRCGSDSNPITNLCMYIIIEESFNFVLQSN